MNTFLWILSRAPEEPRIKKPVLAGVKQLMSVSPLGCNLQMIRGRVILCSHLFLVPAV